MNEKHLSTKRLAPKFITALLIIAKNWETTQMCIKRRMGKQHVVVMQWKILQQ